MVFEKIAIVGKLREITREETGEVDGSKALTGIERQALLQRGTA
jgi:hypothetical protein